MAKRIVNNLLVFYLICTTGAIMIGHNETFIVLPFTLLLLVLNYFRKTYFILESLVTLFFLISVILASVLINSFFSGNYGWNFHLGFIFKILNAFLVINVLPFNEFVDKYINQVYWLSLASIIFYLIFLLKPDLINGLPSLPTDDYHQKNFLLYVYEPPRFVPFPRNMSIFYEPGVFQGIILLAVVLNGGFMTGKVSLFPTAVLIIAILTTFSTTGYLAVIPLLLINNKTRYAFAILLCTGLLFFYDKLGVALFAIWDKISNIQMNISGQRRFTDALLEIQMSISRPVLGYGFEYFNVKGELLSKAGIIEKWSGSTNSIFYHLALYGYLFVLAILWSLWRLSRRIFSGNVYAILAFISILIFINGETFLQKQLFLLMIFYGLTNLRYFRHQAYD